MLDHRGALRLSCRYGMLLAVLPYAALKVSWLSGNMLGIPASSPAYTGFTAANAITLAMDVVAVGLVFALTAERGLRLPAWLVITPAWVGIGFLVPATLIVVVAMSHGLLTTGRPVNLRGGLVEPWAYTLVYLSFAAQGILLTAGFVWYARRRWGAQLAAARPEPVGAVTRSTGQCLAMAGAILGTAIAVVRLFQGVAAPAGWRDAEWTFANRFGEGVEGAMALLAAVGILVLTGTAGPLLRGWSRHAVTMIWIGAGSMFA